MLVDERGNIYGPADRLPTGQFGAHYVRRTWGDEACLRSPDVIAFLRSGGNA